MQRKSLMWKPPSTPPPCSNLDVPSCTHFHSMMKSDVSQHTQKTFQFNSVFSVEFIHRQTVASSHF